MMSLTLGMLMEDSTRPPRVTVQGLAAKTKPNQNNNKKIVTKSLVHTNDLGRKVYRNK